MGDKMKDDEMGGAFVMIYLTTIGLIPGGSSAAHIYTQTEHRIQGTEHT
jgi:hypothetical protein